MESEGRQREPSIYQDPLTAVREECIGVLGVMGDGAGALALVNVCVGTPPFAGKKQTTDLLT